MNLMQVLSSLIPYCGVKKKYCGEKWSLIQIVVPCLCFFNQLILMESEWLFYVCEVLVQPAAMKTCSNIDFTSRLY